MTARITGDLAPIRVTFEPDPTASPDAGATGAAFAAAWNALADRCGAAAWMRPEWTTAWRRAFGRGRPILAVARRGEALVGLVPLEVRRGALCSPTNWHSPAFSPLAEDSQVLDALAQALAHEDGRRVSIGFLVEGDPAVEAVSDAAQDAGHRPLVRIQQRSPYLPLVGDWAAYLGAMRASRRQGLRRTQRRLAELGEVAFEVHDDRTDLDRHLDTLFEIEAASWKGDRGSAMTSQASVHAFYRSIARSLAARGVLRVAFLRVAGRAIAADLVVEEGGTATGLKMGWLPEYRAYAPGFLLRAHQLERAFGLGLCAIDFGGADEAWKLEWTSEVRPRLLVQSFAGPLGRLDRAAQVHGRPMARRIREAWRSRRRPVAAEAPADPDR